MPFLKRLRKASTHKGRKIIESQGPQVIEDPKECFLMQGRKTSDRSLGILKDLFTLKKPHVVMMNRKNDITPFEDANLLEKFARTKNAPLFAVASHSKKRPHNLIFGRTFDATILDMIELGIDDFKKLADFKGDKISTFIKPCLVFNGPAWEMSEDLKRLRSLLIDMFQWEQAKVIRLQGLEHILSFTATEDSKVYMRSYKSQLKKSGQVTPRVELVEIGPSVDFTLRRTQLATDDLMNQACRRPKELHKHRKKNVSRDVFGTKHGRIHMGKQNVSTLQTRKMKGLKKTPEEKKQIRQKKKLALKEAKKSALAAN